MSAVVVGAEGEGWEEVGLEGCGEGCEHGVWALGGLWLSSSAWS